MRPSLARLITLRPYQSECLEAIIESFSRIKRPAVSLPTGSGKTVLFSSLIPRVKPLPNQGNKCLIVVNRREIATQTVSTLARLHPHLAVGLELGRQKYADNKLVDIVVANINSLGPRLEEYDPKEFKMVIVDEAHHAAAPTYREVFDHFGLYEENPPLYLVGFSATLFRRDRKDLGFDDVVYHRGAEEMVDEGHLCTARVNMYDFNIPHPYNAKKGSNNFLMTSEGCALVVKVYDEQYKSTVVFAINNQHTDFLVEKFREQGIDARAVSATMPIALRTSTIEAFRNGEFPVLINCLILTEGTDLPNIDQIILATPVGSSGLALQMIGRGLRTHTDKPHCSIVVFRCLQKWNTHDLAPRIRGIGADVEETNLKILLEGTPKVVPDTPPQQEGTEINELDLVQLDFNGAFSKDKGQRFTSNAWLRYGGQYFLFIGNGISYRVRKHGDKWHSQALYPTNPGAKARFSTWNIAECSAPLEALAECDATVASRHYTQQNIYKRNAPWREQPVTEGQLNTLKSRLPRDLIERLNKGQASGLISLMFLGYKLDEDKVKKAFKIEP